MWSSPDAYVCVEGNASWGVSSVLSCCLQLRGMPKGEQIQSNTQLGVEFKPGFEAVTSKITQGESEGILLLSSRLPLYCNVFPGRK